LLSIGFSYYYSKYKITSVRILKKKVEFQYGQISGSTLISIGYPSIPNNIIKMRSINKRKDGSSSKHKEGVVTNAKKKQEA